MSLAARRACRSLWSSSQALIALVFTLAGACVPAVDNHRGAGASGGGGSGSGGQSGSGPGGSGGSGTGGSSAGTGGSGGGGGSGSGGSSAGSGGAGGTRSGGAGGRAGTGGTDGGTEAGATDGAARITFDEVANNVIVNCVFCHPGEVEVVRNSDFADSAALYDILTSPMPTRFVPAGCAFKRLVVPGKPMESLLYLKLAGPPAGCGARMPLPAEAGKPFMPLRAVDLELVRSWIAGGALR